MTCVQKVSLVDDYNLTIHDINLEANWEKWSYRRQDFLAVFSHPKDGDPELGVNVLNEDACWTVR